MTARDQDLSPRGGPGDRDQVEFTGRGAAGRPPAVAEPLIAGGVRCHGGFDDDGTYVSPRTRFRVPAIEAWQEQHRRTVRHRDHRRPARDLARALPQRGPGPLPHRGGRARAAHRHAHPHRHRRGLRRQHPRPRPRRHAQRYFDEDIRGTAIDHLGKGLFEAHGRDEAGWEEEAGHRDMWFAARDIAFEGATATIDVEAMLARMGFGAARSGGDRPAAPRRHRRRPRADRHLMIRVLLIEVQAFHTFAWAEAWLSDPDLVAGDGEAADLVAYIRPTRPPTSPTWRPPSPRCATARGSARAAAARRHRHDRHAVGQGAGSLARRRPRPDPQGRGPREVEHWCNKRPHGADLIAEFHALATPEVAAR